MYIMKNTEHKKIVADTQNKLALQREGLPAKQPVYYTYKDRVFRLLYKDKKRLLELYNALNDTCYTNEEDLTVNTLENAIFMKMKNDISFLIDCDMCLYEHQSTYCPNMPLRGLLYLTDLYKKYMKDVDLSTGKRIMLPTPHYIVFYNGTERNDEEFIQKLSDSFAEDNEGCLELTVRTININYGHNKKLMDKCKTLSDYSCFISEIRKNLETMSLESAVIAAVDLCIEKDILRDFLLEQKAEVIAMSIYEYNEEYIKKTLHEEGYEEGRSAGIIEGITKGKSQKLIENIDSLMKNLGFSLQKACDALGISVEEYQLAKEKVSSH